MDGAVDAVREGVLDSYRTKKCTVRAAWWAERSSLARRLAHDLAHDLAEHAAHAPHAGCCVAS